MTVHRTLWVGTGSNRGADPESIWRITHQGSPGDWSTSRSEPVLQTPEPSFLTLHPAADRLYAVSETNPGRVLSTGMGADCSLGPVRSVRTRGASPCHIRVHPQGQWLYAANYGDGTLSAIELTEAGDVSEHVLTYEHHGSGADPNRQTGPHAHSTRISPGGGYLMVADLGTDEIRSYALDAGRPEPEPVITTLPAGTGPRHFAGKGSHLYVSAELSGEVLVLEWDEETGQGKLVQQLPGATLPGKSQDAHYLSHILYSRGVVLVASRGSDSLTTFTVHDDGARLEPAGEVHTGAWPRHMAVVGSNVIVAAERADRVVIHPFAPESALNGDGSAVGPVQHEIEIPRPMFILPM
ncbi:MAG TPA: beta-propeller fold lactonase family protein [Beutenbergiaceae bacterium]|nr:beta-propeller fold lactonase family protein [Beutenbergiaceae bacterium]